MCIKSWKPIRTFLFAGVLSLGLTDLARADIIASITGPDLPIANLPSVSPIGAGRATQWQSSLAFEDVSVTADLSSLIGATGTATAFLTTKVGPGATAADEIAHATVSLPDFFAASHTVTLFTGLDLAPADYYLSIFSATGGIWWMSASNQAETTLFPCNDVPCPVTIGAGDPAFPNWQMFHRGAQCVRTGERVDALHVRPRRVPLRGQRHARRWLPDGSSHRPANGSARTCHADTDALRSRGGRRPAPGIATVIRDSARRVTPRVNQIEPRD